MIFENESMNGNESLEFAEEFDSVDSSASLSVALGAQCPAPFLSERRWNDLMSQYKLPNCRDIFDQLTSAYAQRHRAYHTASHVNECLSHLDAIEPLPVRPQEIEMALWFHDAIYKPRSTKNETDSANWCVEFMQSQLIEEPTIARIEQLITVTAHNRLPNTLDEFLITDIDLSILGAESKRFAEYDEAIRFEYKWVPNLLYKRKRKQVLENFLARESLYHLEYFTSRYEQQARDNLKEAIAKL